MTLEVENSRGLLEREGERATIERLLDRAPAGRGSFLAIEGSAGIGKSALLSLARTASEERQITTLAARASELERSFAFGAVRQLFEPQLRPMSRERRERLFGGAAMLAEPLVTGGWVAPKDATTDGALPLLHALYWLLANCSQEGPLLVMFDDLHWADEASLRFLRFLLPRLESLPVVLVVAARRDEPEAAVPSLHALFEDPAVEVLRPAPLSEAGVEATLRASLGEPEPAFTSACHAATRGNPFFLGELIRELARRELPPAGDRAAEVASIGPDSIARLLARRLARLPKTAAELARAVAVLGDAAELRHAARLAGIREREAATAAGLLVRADVLADERPLRFVHPIVRAAVYAEPSEPERAAAHGLAARLLATERALDAAAAHQLLAERTADEHAVDLLIRAAERATGRGSPELAVQFLHRALEEPPPPGRRVELLAALGRAELAVARETHAEAHLREALALADEPRARADVALSLARAIAEGRSMDEGMTLLDIERRRLATVDRDAALELEAELAAIVWLNRANAPPSARIERYAELPGATRTERKLLAAVAQLWAVSGRHAADCVALARRALADGRVAGDEGLGIAHWLGALSVLQAGEDAEAVDDTLAAALADARRRLAPVEFCIVSSAAAACACERGDLASAEASARVAFEVGCEHGLRLTFAASLARVLVERGRFDEADELLRTSGHDGELPSGFSFHSLRFARARLRLAQGRRAEAIADLQAICEIEKALGTEGILAGPHRSMLAVALGESERASAMRLAREEVRLARRWGAPGAIGVALRGLALAGGGERELPLLMEAAAALAASPRRLEHARTLVELGAALRRAGQRREARDPLRQAADMAHRCGADGLLERARAELIASGARPRKIVLSGVESLTPMERRITDLAAQGLRNAEIAQGLFVTVKNVEMHLTRAYRKLGISTRNDLAAALALDGDELGEHPARQAAS